MKKIIFLISFLFPLISFATNYFVSNSGSDGNAGTSAGSPFATITKVNSLLLNAGDIVSFQRNGVWTGTALNITRSGASGNPITYNAYGTGNDPIISAFYTVPTWTSIGGNLYTATIPAGLPTCRVVTMDGNFQAMGKLPKGNNAYYNITSGSATSITSTNTTTNNSNAFPSGTSFTGGQIVWRAFHWSLFAGTINSGAGSTVNFTALPSTSGGGEENPVATFGFFVQNHPSTCTQTGEWAYNGTTHVITMNFGAGGPTGHTVKVSAIDILVSASSRSFVNITGINFQGANQYDMLLSGSTNLNFNGVTVGYSGVYGMYNAGSNINITNSNFLYNNSCAILTLNGVNWNLTSNFFNFNGAFAGMGGVGEGQYFVVRDFSGTAQFNVFKNSGYIPIAFKTGAKSFILNNYFDTLCFVKDDGGAIYCGGDFDFSASVIDHNIVLNSLGAKQGTPDQDGRGNGIYIDDNGHNLVITNNTVAFCKGDGYNFHNAHQIVGRGNTGYDNQEGQVRHYNDKNGAANIDWSRNIMFAKTTSELVYRSSGGANSPSTFFIAPTDSNMWCRPLNEANSFQTLIPSPATNRNLASWQALIGRDVHSKVTPWSIANVNELRFEYNTTNSPRVVNLGGNAYLDVFGVAYSGSLTLAPYTSIILKQTGAANSLPVVNAGPDQSITLPTSQVTMAGSATDADGSIVSHTWAKTSGPAATITTPSSYTTTITGLVAGTYIFQLTAVDNLGGSNTDVMQVIVNPAPNVPPTANAGVDRTIQLPTNTVTQTGSGNDPDGTIAAFLWTQVSGPSTASIASATQATSAFNNLIPGTYIFNLRVTDNQGATGNDQFIVTVNTAANQPPTANAGSNQTITLPTSSVTLTGSGTDPDGTISSYAWTKISGPATFNIVSPSSASTVVNNLVAGTYVFRLTVTDNNGATASATVQVLVNAAPPPNQPPVSNAGTDKNITLPTNSVTQIGIGTDPDGTVTGYAWSKISGPATFTIASPTSSTTVISNLVAGTYVFQLAVTDNQGATGTDQATIIVNPAPNIPPVVNAGPDQTIQLPTSSSVFAGSASDVDGTITAHTWSFIAGPGPTPVITTPSSYTSAVSNMTTAGSYTFQLTVTDNSAATVRDTMIILVNPAPNQPPVANAGTDKNITLPTNSVTQVGSGTDADGTIVGYLWTRISGPAAFNIVSATQATTVINNLAQGTYVFNLRVTDNNGATANDQVTIVVNPAINVPPTANAGTNQTITLPVNSVTLVGSGNDPDGTITGYLWTKISGPATFNIVSPTSATTVVNNLVAGTYVFQLQVTDNQGATASNTVQIVVNPAPPPNQPPISNAGTDKNITLPTNSITQVGSGTDADGTVVSYAWTKISGPATFIIASPSASTTAISNLVVGTYVFQLTVTDNQGATGTDQATVIVNPAPNVPPVPNAGPDQVITLPASSSTFAGSATDQDGTITSHTWTFIAGPGPTPIITTPSSYTSGVSGMTGAGTYTFRLSVTDNSSATVTDDMQILVNAPPNQPPVVNAGSDTTYQMPLTNNIITLTGSGTDDGTIIGYLWTQVSGPTSAVIISASQLTTNVNIVAAGTYVFRLHISDNFGLTTTDDITIIVTEQQTPQPGVPIAHAGPDQKVVIPFFNGSTATVVTGSGTPADRTVIVSYSWRKIAGPNSSLIMSPNTAQTTIRNLSRGVYIFEITVTDNTGQTATDTITIDVRKQWITIRNGKVIIVDL